MNWDEMSDYKVNRKLAWLIHGEDEVIYKNPKTPSSILMHGMQGDLDYCNSWSDMGPLIIQHEICLLAGADCDGFYSAIADIDYWSGMSFQHKKPETHMASGIQAHDKNPLRAAAICLIKKLEDEQ